MTTVLFACIQNAGRSQMAAAFFNLLADPARARALSGGTAPARVLHPEVVEAMGEVGVDLAGAIPQPLDRGIAQSPQLLITLGCGESCPVVPGARTIDWPIPDPQGKSPEEVRAIRSAIRARVIALLRENAWLA